MVRQVFVAVIDCVTDRAERAVAAADAVGGDPFVELRRFVHAAAEARVGAFCGLLDPGFDKSTPDLTESRLRLEAVIGTLMERARTAGQLRADIGVGDLMVVIAQLTRPLPGTVGSGIDRSAHRHIQFFMDGLMGPARSELSGRAATLGDLRQHA